MVRDFVKIRMNGERFWCEVLGPHADGVALRVDSDTVISENPRYREVIILPRDTPYIEHIPQIFPDLYRT